jgi:hypothetical protein
MLIATLEKAIIDRLKAAMPDVQVLPFPLDPSELGHTVTAKQIYVGFKQESLEQPNTVMVGGRVPHQKRKLQFELIIRYQDLRSNARAYTAMDLVRETLSGYRPPIPPTTSIIASPLYQVSGGFVDFGAGLWLYSMTIGIDSILTSKTQPSWGEPALI